MVQAGFLKTLSSFRETLEVEWKTNRGFLIRFLLALFVYGFVTALVYFFLEQPPAPDADPNLVARGIDNPIRLWLNGYLSLFFSFGYLGNINWVGLIMLIPIFLKWRKLKAQERMLLVFFVISVMLIGVNGFFNRRYPLTLLPFTISAVIYFIWTNFPAQSRKFYAGLIILVFFLFIALNNINSTLHLFKTEVAQQGPLTSGSSTIRRLDNVRYLWNHRSELADHFLRVLFRNRGKLDDVAAAYEQKTIRYGEACMSLFSLPLIIKSKPDQTIKILECLPLDSGERVLNNNLPFQFYYTRVPGWYYWCGDDMLMGPQGNVNIMKENSPEEIKQTLKKVWHVRYILSFESYDYYHPLWLKFVKEHARIVWKDPSGYIIYAI